jgi:hypothetical protein
VNVNSYHKLMALKDMHLYDFKDQIRCHALELYIPSSNENLENITAYDLKAIALERIKEIIALDKGDPTLWHSWFLNSEGCPSITIYKIHINDDGFYVVEHYAYISTYLNHPGEYLLSYTYQGCHMDEEISKFFNSPELAFEAVKNSFKWTFMEKTT